jgi:uncharacterized protein (TIGR02594 family)
MSDLNKTIMQHAQKQIGIWEWAGSESNPLILAMFAEAGHSKIKQDAVPWCAAFVGSVLLRVGGKGTGSLLARSYLDWGQKIPLSEAKEGDVVILSGKASWQGHVGFFKGQGAQKINLLGGNQNDQVNVKSYPASKLLGVRRAIAPRENPSESTTLQASTVTALAGASATATAGVAAMHPAAQVALICAGVLVMLAGAYIFRERLRKWRLGDR